jgi:hypothetical protein
VIPGSVNLTELKIPSETSLENMSLPFLIRLTLVHHAVQAVDPVSLPILLSLLHLHLQVMGRVSRSGAHPTFVRLDDLPALQELVVSQRVLPETRWLSMEPYTPENFIVGDSSSLRHATLHEAGFASFTCFTNWLSTTSPKTLLSLSFNFLDFDFDEDDSSELHLDPESWPELTKLRSLELRETDPTYFRAMPYRGLRKLFISQSGKWRLGPLVELLRTVAPSIQAISLIQPASNVQSRARDAYSVFSAPFVDALARCLKLRHFESVGRFFFRVEDWRYLCARAFAFLDQVHVESKHQDLTPLLNELYSVRLYPASIRNTADCSSLVRIT